MQSFKHTFSYQTTSYPYWTYGDTKKPSMLLVPGFTGIHTDLEKLITLLSKNFYIYIADLPGWGESPIGKSDLTIDSYVDFLNELTKQCNTLIIVGHCMGSIVALEFAYKYPKKVLEVFAISIPYPKGDIGEELLYHITKLSTYFPKRLRPLLYFWRSRLLAIPTGFFVIQIKNLREKIKIILQNAYKQQFQNEDTVEKNWTSMTLYNYQKLHKLSVPVHIVHGRKDLLVPTVQEEKLSHIIPHATVDIIPNAGHMPPVETPKELTETILKYF